jgi:16S rRNA (cytidine1402-2'-O)-methyltransferase
MPGVLYVVATPIGNLEDITLRALRVLREATLIAAEDTRRTARLLQHYSISTPTTSLHEHNERSRTPALLARLAAGDSIALVSDAGTPLLSDPGAHLVNAAHAAGVRVEPVPGPTAAMALLSASGLASPEFVFAGFPPARPRARRDWLTRLKPEPRTLILYEAPHRIRGTLQDMLDILGNRIVALGRELTKAHEELTVKPVVGHLDTLGEPRGEYTLVIAPEEQAAAADRPVPDATQLIAEFGDLTNSGATSRREALRALAARHGISSRTLYRILEDAKSSGN